MAAHDFNAIALPVGLFSFAPYNQIQSFYHRGRREKPDSGSFVCTVVRLLYLYGVGLHSAVELKPETNIQ